MSTQTPNIGLTKPAGNEKPQVSVINGNSDILDAAIGDVDVSTDGSLQSQVDALRDSVTQETLTNATDFLTPESGLTVSAHLSRQGRVVFVYFQVTTNAAQSQRWLAATMKQEYRPLASVYGIEWSTNKAFEIGTDGRIRAYFSTTAAGTFYTSFSYMLPI